MSDSLFDKALEPMLIASEKPAFNDKNFIYELKLDGTRALVYLDQDTQIYNKRRLSLQHKFPELKQLHTYVKHRCILDGELFVYHDNHVDFFASQKRQLLSDRFKIQIASASVEKAKEIESMNIRGRDLVTGLPKSIDINAEDVAKAIQEVVQNIIVAIKETLEETSPEIAADVIDHGIVLTGGGALLKNLPEVISDATKVPVFIAQDPLDCVAIGTGESLKNIEVMRKRR